MKARKKSPSSNTTSSKTNRLSNLSNNARNVIANHLKIADLLLLSQVSKQHRSHTLSRTKFKPVPNALKRVRATVSPNKMTDTRRNNILRQMNKNGAEVVAEAFEAMRKHPWSISGGLYSSIFLKYSKTRDIEDSAMKKFATVLASGALPNLSVLRLWGNQIGDVGLSALAKACANGALTNLRTLDLGNNNIRDNGLKAFASACANGALPNLECLYLDANQVGDLGLKALAQACANGALPKCMSILLTGNPGNHRPVQNVLRDRVIDANNIMSMF